MLRDIDLASVVPYIDWTFFFHAWQLKGRFPKILDDPEKGPEARRLYADAQAMLTQIVDQHWLLGGLETLGIGALAAGIAYAIGYLLSPLVPEGLR